MTREIRIDRETPLDACEGKGAAVVWPLPLAKRMLTISLSLWRPRTRERPARSLLRRSSSLLLRTRRKLARILRDYRAAKVGDLAPASDIAKDVAVFERHRPGPRRRAQ